MTVGAAIVVVPPELEAGFRLAGVATVTARTTEEAVASVERLAAERMEGVVAVYEPYLVDCPPAVSARFERSLTPVIVGLPAGLREPSGDIRRARIADMLTRAVGYQVTFGTKGEL